ncbi:MAG TPA: SAM-dependent methyltransferase, partial [Ottowia sp.]|nr:SAM-dependent methyltransferase [Ottowia sp.]
MRADPLVSTAARLLQQALRFEHPADAVLARFVREHRALGPRERARLGDALYAVLRRRRLFEHLA